MTKEVETVASENIVLKTYRKRKKTEQIVGMLFAAPIILKYLIFMIGPMLLSLYYSFTDYKVIGKTNWVGLQNYTKLFQNADTFTYNSFKVTIYYTVLYVILTNVVAYMLAVSMAKNLRGRTFFRTVFYIPSILPLITSCFIFSWLLSPDMGVINYFIKVFGGEAQKFLTSRTQVIPSLAISSLWWCGMSMMIYLAGIKQIPGQLYEAFKVDGGNWIQKHFKITIPMLTPTILVNLITTTISGFQIFAQADIMTAGGPGNASYFAVYYIYQEAFAFFRFGKASAISWLLFIIIFVFVLSIFGSSKKWVHYAD